MTKMRAGRLNTYDIGNLISALRPLKTPVTAGVRPAAGGTIAPLSTN
jgi:hypothetical protein